MRVYYDTEFTESGPREPVDLISIGMVAEDGRELHRVLMDFDLERARAHPFVSENVLPGVLAVEGSLWKPRDAVREDVRAFLAHNDVEADPPELWAFYSAYDHLCLAQLFGRMVDMPKWCPWFTRDLVQEVGRIEHTARERGEIGPTDRLVLPEQDEGVHDALADARHLQVRWDFVSEWALARGIDPPQ